jgi:signal transduction histidine kinase
MLRSFRLRLSIAIVLLVAFTAAAVAAVSLTLVERSLRSQLVDDAVAQATFNIGVLADEEQLPRDAGADEFEASGLAERFQLRGSDGVYVEFDGDIDVFTSSLALVDVGEVLPEGLRRLVADGRIGSAFVEVAGEPFVVVGGRRLPAGPDFYFFVSASGVDEAVGSLRGVLAAAGLAVVVVAALVAGLISRRVLRPVGHASTAAAEMANGDLSVRLPEGSADEFGTWARAFNTMATSLEAKVGELQAARERERRFVADVSHELRTPLTALVAEAEMAKALLDTAPDHAARVGELLVADVDRMRRLVEDLLEISRLDAAAPSAVPEALDLRRFVAAVAAERYPAAIVDVADVGIVCDRLALERILGNLLDNARRHAPEATVTVVASVSDGVMDLQVADDGPGIAQDDLERIFDRFATGDASRHGGTGLGLAIAREHALRMGGTLTAEPRTPHGVAFRLVVPVTESLQDCDRREKSGSHDGEVNDPTSRRVT